MIKKHRYKFNFKTVLLSVILAFILFSCRKNELKREVKISTKGVSEVMATTAKVTGEIIDMGEGIEDYGVYYSTTANNSNSQGGTILSLGKPSATGEFIVQLIGLNTITKYYTCAYSETDGKYIYGSEKVFTTLGPSVVTTTAATAITTQSATIGGNVNSDGGATVTDRGVYWRVFNSPDTIGTKLQIGTGTGVFSASLNSLSPNALYYFKAYATNSVGTSFGVKASFTTAVALPTVNTSAISDITATTATGGGEITSDGGAAITARGVCWGTFANPTISNSKTSDGTGSGLFTSNITGLLPGQTYHARAYATNSFGINYGIDVQFTTKTTIPRVTTTAISLITASSATSGGNVTSDGGSAVTLRGVCWSTITNPTTTDSKTTDGAGSGIYISNITVLTPGLSYHVRAYATNSVGTSYGDDIPFTTGIIPPSVTTAAITAITTTSATSGGNVTSDGGAAVSARGVCWSIVVNPTTSDFKTSDGTGIGIFNSNITGLTPNTFYYLRAYAINSAGTAYGNVVSFSTGNTIIFDVDNNFYKTVKIGTQIWMAENLKTTRYRNGDTIRTTSPATLDISNQTTPHFQWAYGGNQSNIVTYGRLYTWYAVTDSRNLCPTGWHVPSDAEWTTMENYLITNGYNYDGTNIGNKIAKSLASSTLWGAYSGTGVVGNTDYPIYRNKSGFTALPGGSRYSSTFEYNVYVGFFWSSDESNATLAWDRTIHYDLANVKRNSDPKYLGLSVRCLRDN
jgi:uncharacterized protein (TIGR02145 family)